MRSEELKEEMRDAQADWDRKQNRLNELLSYLKVAEAQVKTANQRIEQIRDAIYKENTRRVAEVFEAKEKK